MPIRVYVCEDGHETDELVFQHVEARGEAPVEIPCAICAKRAVQRFSPEVALHVPAYMSATRSGASERQAAYLKSPRERANRKRWDRIMQKQEENQGKLDSFLHQELGGATFENRPVRPGETPEYGNDKFDKKRRELREKRAKKAQEDRKITTSTGGKGGASTGSKRRR